MVFIPDFEKYLKTAEFKRIWPADLEEAMNANGEAATSFKIDFDVYHSWSIWVQTGSDPNNYPLVILMYEYDQNVRSNIFGMGVEIGESAVL